MNISPSERRQLVKRLLEDKEFRDAMVDSEIGSGISFQLKTMLRERELTQQELARLAGTAQPLISKYLGGYERYSLQTLKGLAAALNVALIVSFAPFSELVARIAGRDYERLNIPPIEKDRALLASGLTNLLLEAAPAQTGSNIIHMPVAVREHQMVLLPSHRLSSVPIDITRGETSAPVNTEADTNPVVRKEWAIA